MGWGETYVCEYFIKVSESPRAVYGCNLERPWGGFQNTVFGARILRFRLDFLHSPTVSLGMLAHLSVVISHIPYLKYELIHAKLLTQSSAHTRHSINRNGHSHIICVKSRILEEKVGLNSNSVPQSWVPWCQDGSPIENLRSIPS